MKIILGIGIILSCSILGIGIKDYMRSRVLFYECVLSFIDEFCVNVNFLQKDFISFLNTASYKSKEFVRFIGYFKALIKNEQVSNFNSDILSQTEIDEVIEFMQSIGSTDLENQLTLLQGNKEKFKNKLNNTKELYSKYSGVAIKMSVLCGGLVCLLLI